MRRYSATLLADGKLLIAGGYGLSSHLNSVELFDPTANSKIGAWSDAPALESPRYLHTAILLKDNKVLVYGGYSIRQLTNLVEIFDPTAKSDHRWDSASPLKIKRSDHSATLLRDGRVLVVGATLIFVWVTPSLKNIEEIDF